MRRSLPWVLAVVATAACVSRSTVAINTLSAPPCPAKAGDALFFSYLTIHGSGYKFVG